MKKTALRLTVFLLSAAMMITAMPLGALALDRQQQEDLYRVGEWSQNPYNQSITWLIDSDNFLYHLDRTGRSIFRDWDYDIMNLNPLERQKNYKDVIVATIDLVHEDIRNMAASELAKEATEGFFTQLISDVAEGEGMIRSVLETIQEAMKLSLEDGAIPIEGMSYQWIEDILVAELGTEDWTKYVKKYFYAIRDKTDWLSKTESFSYALALINSGFQIHKEGIGLIAEYESYFRANEKFNEYLHYIAAQTDDAALRAACNEVRRRMSSDTLAANLTADMVQRMGGVLVENIGVKMFTDILSSSCFGVRMALLGYEAGNFVADELFNASEMKQFMKTLHCVNEISELTADLVSDQLSNIDFYSSKSETAALHASRTIYSTRILLELRLLGEKAYYNVKESAYESSVAQMLINLKWIKDGFNGELSGGEWSVEQWFNALTTELSRIRSTLFRVIDLSLYYEEPEFAEYIIEDGHLVSFNGDATGASVPGGVHTIDAFAFSGRENLRRIEFPESVGLISEFSVHECPGVTSITVNSKDAVISEGAFIGAGDELTIYGFSGSTAETYANEHDINFVALHDPFGGIVGYEDPDFVIENDVLVKYVGSGGDVYIPYGIKKIGSGAFSESAVRTVVVSETVEEIDDSAFSGCKQLLEVKIPGSVKMIRSWAFGDCQALRKVELENGIEYIGYAAFQSCVNLESIEIPDSVKEIGSYAFRDCLNMEKAVIGSGVDCIGDSSFSGCASLADLTIKNGVAEIGDSAFSGCTSLTEVKIPGSVKMIRSWAFNDCTALQKAELESGIELIGYAAFQSCVNLESIEIPDSVKEIGSYAFRDCLNMEKAVIGSGVDCIGDSSFSGCASLADLTIKNGVAEIGDSAFSGCTSLTEVKIPGSVKKICSFAFSYCTDLEALELQEGIEEIGYASFRECINIEDLIIPDSVKKIESYAFADCLGLISVTLGQGVVFVDRSAFSGCGKLLELCNKSPLVINADSLEYDDMVKSIVNIYSPGAGASRLFTRNGYRFYKDGAGNYYLVGYNGDDTVLRLPTAVDGSGYYVYRLAFVAAGHIEGVVMGNGVKGIGADAFLNPYGRLGVVYCGDEERWTALPKETGWDAGTLYGAQLHLYQNGSCYFCGEKEPSAAVAGDVNGDEKVTNSDVLMIYQYIYDPEANGLDVSLADVNKDEKVTNADVLMMLRYIYDPIRYPIA